MAACNLKKNPQKESLYQDCIFIHQSHKKIPSAYLLFCYLNLKFCWFNIRFLSILIHSWRFSHSSQVNHTIAIQSILLDIPRLHSGWLSAQHPHVDSGWSRQDRIQLPTHRGATQESSQIFWEGFLSCLAPKGHFLHRKKTEGTVDFKRCLKHQA